MRTKESIGQKIRLKYLFTKRGGGAWGQDLEGEEGTVCLRAADIETEKVTHKTYDLTRRLFSEEELLNKGLQPGDLVIEKSGGGENQPVGRIAFFQLNEPALCSNFMELLRPEGKKVLPQYAAFLLYSLWLKRVVTPSIKQTTGIQNLDVADYLNNKIFLPTLPIQERIMDYLKNELCFIDNLIAQKEQLISLLTEKRQALITQAVTRGLDPNVKLKNSGVDWLGDVPEHWEVLALKHVCKSIKTGGTPSPEWINFQSDTMIDWFTPGDINGKDYLLKSSSRKLSIEAIKNGGHSLYPKGSIFIVGIGTIGKAGYILNEAYCNQQINILIITDTSDSEYITYLLSALENVMKMHANSSTLPILNQQKMGEIIIVRPPLAEQRTIANYIRDKINQFSNITELTLKSIALLKERRAALISAAVTGQIEIPTES